VENIGEKVARKNLVDSSLTDDKESVKTEEWKQTQFSTVTATGFEIECIGCEG
jgi:hypothetical protein